ncbi:MAG: hypothetical protein Q8927_10455 [Bacteroidota bacterium]|nr:hypothetical protein [Bacteroidota bacterium]
MSPKLKSLIGARALVMITGSSFAAPAAKHAAVKTHKSAIASDDLSNQIRSSFKNEFNTAQLISWQVTSDFTKLTFLMNGNVMFAFYAPDGELLAVSRNILSSQLPISLTRNLKSSYADYWIADLFEISSETGNYYYVTLENSDRKIVLRSVGTSAWEKYYAERK